MTIKETIRAEIDRRRKTQLDKNGYARNLFCAVRLGAYADLLALLDTLPEQPVEMDNEEKIRNFFDALGDCGFSQDDILLLKSIWEDAGCQIPQQEQPVTDCHDLEQGPDLDSEIFFWQKAHANEDTAQVIAMTARHFAEWGASHAVAPYYFKLCDINTGRVFLAEWSDIAGEWHERGNGKAYQSDEVLIVQHAKTPTP